MWVEAEEEGVGQILGRDQNQVLAKVGRKVYGGTPQIVRS